MATRRGPALAGGCRPIATPATRSAWTPRCCSSRASTSPATTRAPQRQTSGGRTSTGTSYRGRFDYTDDRYGAAAEHMLIDGDFRPEVGFVRRTDFRRTFGQLRFSPRPRRSARRPQAHLAGEPRLRDRRARRPRVQSREAAGLFRVDFQSSDQLSARVLARVRAAAGAVPDRARRRRAGRRLHRTATSRAELHARPAAPRLGPAHRRRPARSTTARDRKPATAAGGAWCRASRSSRASP